MKRVIYNKVTGKTHVGEEDSLLPFLESGDWFMDPGHTLNPYHKTKSKTGDKKCDTSQQKKMAKKIK